MKRILLILLAMLAFTMPAAAQSLPLTVEAKGVETVYSVEELEKLGLSTVRTSTTWTDGTPVFEGVLMSDIAKAHGVSGGTVMVTAINDYQAEIPVAEILAFPVLLATRMNGERMSVRDKGPFWIIYPRDEFPEFADERHNFKWVWQVKELRFQ